MALKTTHFSGPVISDTGYVVGASVPMGGPIFRSGVYFGPNSMQPEGASAFALSTMQMVGFPVGKTTSFDRIGINCTALGAGSTVRLGIYNDNGFNTPGTLLVD